MIAMFLFCSLLSSLSVFFFTLFPFILFFDYTRRCVPSQLEQCIAASWEQQRGEKRSREGGDRKAQRGFEGRVCAKANVHISQQWKRVHQPERQRQAQQTGKGSPYNSLLKFEFFAFFRCKLLFVSIKWATFRPNIWPRMVYLKEPDGIYILLFRKTKS